MTTSSRPRARRTFELAVHSLGALILASFSGTLLTAVAGYVSHVSRAAGHAGAVDFLKTSTWVEPDPDYGAAWFSYECGALGFLAGSALVGVMLIVSALSSRHRRKMIAIFERVRTLLTLFAITGSICGTVLTIMWASGDDGVSTTDPPSWILFHLAIEAGGLAFAFGLLLGVLSVTMLTVVVLVRILAGVLNSACTSLRPAPVDLIVDTNAPRLIRAAAAFMPPEYGRRWRDDVAEALFDYEPDEHPELLRDFLLHAPAAIAWAWTATLQRHVRGAGHSRGRQE
ncbi:hypothetical protein BZB76_4141 [Actinomadura pelletieri DSM 43383]|uniref:Uncharacterized protein n=1 Tax=Actinomadura pelletieri DSM 43383 TaxID=1120940 RepID=A0A495QLK1_9ACTN|nr:hypothetical protein [Actinomadura pelletieri]RKS73450.1 hypothetical protein BZB76_4141 [Actinomadura pelletieri DSM 43383]